MRTRFQLLLDRLPEHHSSGHRTVQPFELCIMHASARIIAEATEAGNYWKRLRDFGLLEAHGPESSRPACVPPKALLRYLPGTRAQLDDAIRALKTRRLIGFSAPGKHCVWELDRLEKLVNDATGTPLASHAPAIRVEPAALEATPPWLEAATV